MTASLPEEVQAVFQRFVSTEYTTVDRQGQPITWPVTPYYKPGGPCIDVSTGVGYPKKANDAVSHPQVALLFSDPTGSGLERPPMVLVQGTAEVDDDLEANAARYARESKEKVPAWTRSFPPPGLGRFFTWYTARIYIHVRPERIYAWPEGDATREPQLFDAHMEEVRSGHSEEPNVAHERPAGGSVSWDPRVEELGTKYPTAVLSFLAPDGFPFSVRVPVRADGASRRIRIGDGALGLPVEPGLACLTAHEHAPDFRWQRNFQVRGDLVAEDDGSWSLVPHRLVGGMEAPKNKLEGLPGQLRRMWRMRARAKREMAQRGHG
jgi:hypothetical protein